ncbi:MBL fold metallo-hydrolase [Pontibacter ummariensis]|uniref:MBL fold metallo-hydrolase n=1 Tax=Pontibacter ummariensis TaxID=1610492 RepID=UPI001C52CAC9|nr:MBL fold metallo-hydrolase [Pontibacter ummariensis]
MNWNGQSWTTLKKLQITHANQFKKAELGLYEIWTAPDFGIGQRALLLQTPEGNILWDCISLLDEATVEIVEKLGGIKAIAISHPHYYSSMVEWAQAFDAPVYIHEKDREWIMRPDEHIQFWSGSTLALLGGTRLIHVGGHFPGSFVLHWPKGANGRGALLTGDILNVEMNRSQLSFMYSYPNHFPLPEKAILYIKDAMEGLAFDRIYSAWNRKVAYENGRQIFDTSVERYLNIFRS